MENRDGTFDLYEVPKVQVENMDEQYKGKAAPLPIRPFELKTYLKVGKYVVQVVLPFLLMHLKC